MDKDQFLIEKRGKLCAIKWFSECFNNNLTISSSAKETLEKEYLKYCKSYLDKFGFRYDDERREILRGYIYITQEIDNAKFNQVESDISKNVLLCYDKLTEEISKYHFTARGEDSYGAIQNRTNMQILFDISLLRPVLVMILQSIDKMPNNNIKRDIELKLQILINDLTNKYLDLKKAQLNYHNDWYNAKKVCEHFAVSDRELGYSKKKWKKERNSACNLIINFYYELFKIGISISDERFINIKSEFSSLFKYGIDNIVNGPNYYCFLNDEERKELSKSGLSRKLKKGYKRYNKDIEE